MADQNEDFYNLDRQLEQLAQEKEAHHTPLDFIEHLFYHNILIQLVIALSIIGTVAAVFKLYLDTTRSENIQSAEVNIPTQPPPSGPTESTPIAPVMQIFTQNDLQFAFNYPVGYKIVEYQSDHLFEAVLIREGDGETNNALMSIAVYLMDKTSVDAWVRAHSTQGNTEPIYFPGASGIAIGMSNNYTIVGFNDIIPETSSPIRRIVFSQNGIAYVLTSNNITESDVFESVVKSFTFFQN